MNTISTGKPGQDIEPEAKKEPAKPAPLMPLPARLALVFGSGGLYLTLAVACRGGLSAYFSIPALSALAVALLLLCIVSLFAGGNVSSGSHEARDNRWVLLVFSLIGLLMAFVPALTDRKEFWVIDGDSVRWIGVVLFSIGGAVRIWPVFVLGDRFSGLVAIQKGHSLVTTGIYRYIRNPSYLGLLINSVGWSLSFRSSAGLILTALLIPPLVARMRSEETLLHSHFGAEYAAYYARAWRLIPGVY